MNVKLYKECVRLPLGHNEKHVLRSLASFAARGCRDAFPSVETIAEDTSLGTTIVRRCLRNLEAVQVVAPEATTRGGGRGCTTHYFITPENHKPNARVSALPEENPTLSEKKPNTFGGKTQHTCVDEGFIREKQKERQANDAAAISKEQMARKIVAVWNYYQDATGNEEILSPSIKKIVGRRLCRLDSNRDVVGATSAIDAAVQIAKDPKKKFMLKWYAIFGKESTFLSLIDDYHRRDDVTDAAELAEEWNS